MILNTEQLLISDTTAENNILWTIFYLPVIASCSDICLMYIVQTFDLKETVEVRIRSSIIGNIW